MVFIYMDVEMLVYTVELYINMVNSKVLDSGLICCLNDLKTFCESIVSKLFVAILLL